ncbi:MAG: alginate export family protein [Archangiaceae bacterium]|nr:alginate export family protein [Archangiaceae bacterium]
MSLAHWLAGALLLARVALAADGGVPEAQPAAAADAGVMASAAAPPAPAPDPSFDWGSTLWGPGRRTSGDAFRSMAAGLLEGPFRIAGAGWSLGFGAQYHARGELRTDTDFDRATEDHAIGIDHRARLTLRGSALERVGALLELQDVRGWGAERSTLATDSFTGLHQGFVDLKAARWLDLRIGRQELAYGEDRLLGSVDWNLNARAFDGLFARLSFGALATVDVFGMMLKAPGFVDPASGGARFHNSGSWLTGAYARFRVAPSFGFDVYALGLSTDESTAATGMRRDTNHATLGARLVAKVQGLTTIAEGALQAGSAHAGGVLAGAFAARATYPLPVWSEPYAQLEVLGATGDGDAADGRVTTFNPLFPTAHLHLGYLDYVAWQNTVSVRGTLGFRPFGAHVWLDVHHFRLMDPRGAWYSASGAVFRPADPSRADTRMGTEVDLSAAMPVTKHVGLSGAYAVFFPEGAAAGPGRTPSQWGFVYLRAQL